MIVSQEYEEFRAAPLGMADEPASESAAGVSLEDILSAIEELEFLEGCGEKELLASDISSEVEDLIRKELEGELSNGDDEPKSETQGEKGPKGRPSILATSLAIAILMQASSPWPL